MRTPSTVWTSEGGLRAQHRLATMTAHLALGPGAFCTAATAVSASSAAVVDVEGAPSGSVSGAAPIAFGRGAAKTPYRLARSSADSRPDAVLNAFKALLYLLCHAPGSLGVA